MIFLDMNLIQVCGGDYKLRPSLFGASVCLGGINTKQVELESRLFHGTLTAPEALFCHAQCHMVESHYSTASHSIVLSYPTS
jgi:hypothetical protein